MKDRLSEIKKICETYDKWTDAESAILEIIELTHNVESTGLDSIHRERAEQINIHKRTVQLDVKLNDMFQLSSAASLLCYPQDNCLTADDIIEDHCPVDWNRKIWSKMVLKPYKQRLIIAGALIAAEIDRLNYIEQQ